MKIKHIRKAQGLTQTALSEKLNVDRSTVAMWETGKAKPRVDKLIEMAKLFGCTVDELLRER